MSEIYSGRCTCRQYYITLGEPRRFGLPNLLGGYHLWQSKDDNSTAPTEFTTDKGEDEWEMHHIRHMSVTGKVP